MTSSPEPLRESCRRRCRRCGGCASSATSTSRRLMSVAFVLALLSALPDALIALWLKLLGDGVLGTSAAPGDRSGARPRRVRDRDLVPADGQHARAAPLPRQGDDRARIARRALARHDRDHRAPRTARLPRSAVDAARSGLRARSHVHVGVLDLRVDPPAGVTIALLASIHPALVLLAVFALPTVLTSTWRPGVERAAQEARRAVGRLARHLFTLATTAPPGKEVRVTGIGRRLIRERREAWERWHGPIASGAVGIGDLAYARVGRLRRRVCRRRRLRRVRPAASPGDVLLVLAAGSRLSAYIGATVGEIGFLRGFWMDGSRRLAWLEDYAASLVAAADRPVPGRAAATAFASSTCRSRIRAPHAWCSTTCR